VRICEGADLGAGAVVLPKLTVGADAVLGAGAVAVRDVAPGITVVGVPARPLERR
jgi:acetyltransferase-like isoleucine patch superfamily enzyme